MAFKVDFELPGRLQSPNARSKSHIGLAVARSTGSNPRGLEYYWYPAWCQILMDLVEDLRLLLLAPQFDLYLGESDGDGVRDSPLHSDGSYHEKPNQELIVDFAVVNVRFDMKEPNLGYHFKNLRITYIRVPMLIECKVRPGRNVRRAKFDRELSSKLLNARVALLKQSKLLFHRFVWQRSVVVVAVSGEWWMYGEWGRDWVEQSILLLQQGPDPESSDPESSDDESSEDDDSDDPDYIPDEEIWDTKTRSPAEVPDEDEFDGEFEMELIPEDDNMPEQDDVEEMDLEPSNDSDYAYGAPRHSVEYAEVYGTEAELRGSWPINACSETFELETDPSNQAFFLLHEHLQMIANRVDNFTQG
ncbi:hypothetical protein OBBRIDRAFT_507712 [Obba rivulosa]|uniref:Uncharacterized protein n=1 Tax=Obba rivulosa TaxID=1052685 RepID=A0A8E2AFW8_9APHY|nr:hypothetical protein OBBRIDRAFT_507712 [Obba rivulosa]